MDEKLILVSKMYTGGYIEENIGHEIINFFKPDNKKESYIYILHSGMIDEDKVNKISHILFTSNKKDGRVKVLGKAEGFNQVFVDYPKEKQIDYINNNNIRYGGVLLNNIMLEKEDNYGMFISFKADKVMKAKKDIYIVMGKKNTPLKYHQKNEEYQLESTWNIGHQTGYISSKNKKEYNNFVKSLLENNNDDLWEEVKDFLAEQYDN